MSISLRDVEVTYPGPVPVRALRGIDLDIEDGEFVAITGPSGSGKSTLLNVIGLLEVPTAGRYVLDGTDVAELAEPARAAIRSRRIGFVFQSFHLLGRRTVQDNAQLGLMYQGTSLRERRTRAAAALEMLGLTAAASRTCEVTSGGERQRTAIARAVASEAQLIVADEPTGNLDTANSDIVMTELRRLHGLGRTVVIVTHDRTIADHADRHLTIRDGLVVSDQRTHASRAVREETRTGAEPRSPESSPQRRGRPRFIDLVTDAWATLRSRPARSASLAGAVALATGLAVATTGLASSASAQVSEQFDARLNREVTVSWQTEDPDVAAPVLGDPEGDGAFSAASVERLSALAGVDAVAVLASDATSTVDSGLRTVPEVPVYRFYGDLVRAGGVRLAPDSAGLDDPAPDTVAVGTRLADRIGLGPLVLGPRIVVDGVPLRVTSVITASRREPDLLNAVVLGVSSSDSLAPDVGTIRALIHVQPGAAQQVAGQAVVATDPVATSALTVRAPEDPRDLRQVIEADLRTTLVVLTVVAMLAAVVSLTSATVMSVVERTAELGVRRALGARRSDVSWGILAESTTVGVIGGAAGAYVGLMAVIVVSLAQGWAPVFDFRLVPAAVGAGVVVGTFGATFGMARAARVQPSRALRSS